MSIHATSRFAITSWDEKPYDVTTGRPKLTRARVTQSYELVAESVVYDALYAFCQGIGA